MHLSLAFCVAVPSVLSITPLIGTSSSQLCHHIVEALPAGRRAVRCDLQEPVSGICSTKQAHLDSFDLPALYLSNGRAMAQVIARLATVFCFPGTMIPVQL